MLRQGLNVIRRPAWLPLIFILGVAILIRIPYLPGNGFEGDLGIFQSWITLIQNHGIFHFYETVPERTYPPISIFLLATTIGDFASIKLPSLIAEVLIVAAAYGWLRREKMLRWLIPGFLALHPGLIITTVWWGQNDALYTLLILLVLIALNRDRTLIAWVLFGLALATKQQSVVIIPLMLILSFRRYGWQRTVVGGLLAVVIVISIFLPFILASDPRTAFSSYLVLLNPVSSISNNAFNLWYVIAKLSGIGINTGAGTLFWGDLSYAQMGQLFLIAYTLIVSLVMWKQFDQRREFIWASALYLGSFTLQTQIHERYLYPVSILALLAIQQDYRMWPVAIGILLTFTYNLVNQAVPTHWLGLPLVTSASGLIPVALLNVILLFEMQLIIMRPLHFDSGRWVNLGKRVVFRTLRICAAGLLLIIFFKTTGMALGSYAAAHWLSVHAAEHTQIVSDTSARYTPLMTNDSAHSYTGEWQLVSDVVEKNSLAWLGDGVHYLLADLTDDEKTDQRRQSLANEPTTLLYEYQSPLHFGPHLAIFWTFRPDHQLNITFDSSLLLVGCNVVKTQQGLGLLLHWYTRQTTSAVYTAYIHLLDPRTGKMLSQADTPLGGGTHPTNTWRPNELVFETIDLPHMTSPYIIRMGLYQSNSRAEINDRQGNPIGDHIDIIP